MFLNLNPDYIKQVKKENRQRRFALNDYLPNSLKRDQSMSQMSNEASQVPLHKMGSGLIKHKKSRTTMQASTQDDLSRTGRNSPSLNRLASLSDLNSVKQAENTTMYIAESRKYINYETMPGFVDQEISKINNRSANIIEAPERRQRAAKYLQLTNKLP